MNKQEFISTLSEVDCPETVVEGIKRDSKNLNEDSFGNRLGLYRTLLRGGSFFVSEDEEENDYELTDC